MSEESKNFPQGFLWGSATSSHQVEGNCDNDWSRWEKANAERLAEEAEGRFSHLPNWPEIKDEAQNPQNYISGRACDHYHRFEEDFDIAKSLGHNAHRFSIEWSRIEPEEGKFNEVEIEHYRQVILALRTRGIEPFVTLNHWTLPLWFSEKGGWQNSQSVINFAKFVDFVAKNLKNEVNFWITLNEPGIYIAQSYLLGLWPPQKKSLLVSLKILKNLLSAHKSAFNIIKSFDPKAQVGLVDDIMYYEGGISFLADWFANREFLNLVGRRMDFIGLNFYFHQKFSGFKFIKSDSENKSDLGWEIHPEGIYHVLKKLKRYHRPIYITENGLADAKDAKRAEFIREHLKWTQKAIAEGVDVQGYFHWSLLDNFEWDKGFWPRFGLVEIDYKTLERKIRPSALEYAKICKNNVIASPAVAGRSNPDE